MGDSVIIEGKEYISVRRASEMAKYDKDYVGQLSRSGKIVARKVGRVWFVQKDSLLNHKKEADLKMHVGPQVWHVTTPASATSTHTINSVKISAKEIATHTADLEARPFLPPLASKRAPQVSNTSSKHVSHTNINLVRPALAMFATLFIFAVGAFAMSGSFDRTMNETVAMMSSAGRSVVSAASVADAAAIESVSGTLHSWWSSVVIAVRSLFSDDGDPTRLATTSSATSTSAQIPIASAGGTSTTTRTLFVPGYFKPNYAILNEDNTSSIALESGSGSSLSFGDIFVSDDKVTSDTSSGGSYVGDSSLLSRLTSLESSLAAALVAQQAFMAFEKSQTDRIFDSLANNVIRSSSSGSGGSGSFSGGALSATTGTFSGLVSIAGDLGVTGNTSLHGNLGVTGDSTLTGDLNVGGVSTLASAVISSLSVGSLTGILQAIGGTVTASSTISPAYGGTGLSSVTANQLLIGDSSGGWTQVATSSLGITASAVGSNGALQYNDAGTFGAAADFIYDKVNRFFGIGTTTPFARLSVGGDAYVGGNLTATGTLTSSATSTASAFVATNSSATSTFAGNVSVVGNINLNGSLLQNGSPFTTSQWTTGGSNIYYSTGNVGIGTTSPWRALSVNGSSDLGTNALAGSFTATSTTATSTFPILRAGELMIVRTDGSWTMVSATTSSDVGRGTALLTAVSRASLSDVVYISQGTFDIGANTLDLSKGNSSNLYAVSIRGAGKYATTITGSASTLVKAGNNSDTTDLSIIASGPGSYRIPWGLNNTGADLVNSRIKNVYLRGYEDGLYINVNNLENLIVEDVTVDTSWDAMVVFTSSNPSTVTIKNSDFNTALDGNLFSPRRSMNFSDVSGDGLTVNIYDSHITSDQNAIFVNDYTTVNLYGGFATGLLNEGGTNSTINVSPNTSFDPTSTIGSVTYLRPSVIAYNLANYAGNVGVGTTSPFAKFSVGGNSYFGGSVTATGTLSLRSTLTDFNGSVGTNGYVLQTTGTGVQWVATSSLGITTGGGTPGGSVNSIQYNNGGTFDGFGSWNGSTFSLGTADLSFAGGNINLGGGILDHVSILSDASGDESVDVYNRQLITNNGNTIVANWSNGNFGIGTSSPWRTLSVNGSSDLGISALAGYFTATSSTASVFPYASTTGITSSASAYFATSGGSVGIGTTSPWGKFSVNPNGVTGPAFVVGSSTATSFVVTNGGKVGIGTSTPGVYGGTSGDILTLDSANSQSTRLRIANTSSSRRTWDIGVFGNGSTPAGAFGIGDLESNSWRLLINTSGDVGIGTTNPSARLDVRGGINNLLVSESLPTSSAGSNTTGNTPQNVVISGRYAYVTNYNSATMQVFDITNLSNPQSIGSVGTQTGPYGIVVAGRYAYVTDSGANKIEVIDISNPSSPSVVGSATTGLNPYNIYVSGKYVYVVSISGTLEAFDVSNPTSPVRAGTVATGGSSPEGVFISGRYAYVTDNTNDTFTVIDISDPSRPTVTGSTVVASTPHNLYVSGQYAYVVAYGADELDIVDVSSPSAPSVVGTLELNSNPYNIYVAGRYAYILDRTAQTLEVVDVADPGVPAGVGSINLGGTPAGMAVSGKTIVVTRTGSPGSLVTFAMKGFETGSALIHSLESGNLSVLDDITAGGQLRVRGGLNVGSGGILSAGSIASVRDIFAGTRLAVGTTSPFAQLQIATSSANTTFKEQLVLTDNAGGTNLKHIGLNNVLGNFNIDTITDLYATTTRFTLTSAGNVGIGTTSPWGMLSLNPNGITGPAFVIGSSTATIFNFDTAGLLTLGTAGFANGKGLVTEGGISVGTGAIAASAVGGQINLYNSNTNIASLNSTGLQQRSSGLIQWSSTSASSGSADIGLSRLAAGKLALGNGTANDTTATLIAGGIGVGTSTPWATLAVNPTAGTASNQFVVGSSTATNFVVKNDGRVGIGSSTPFGRVDIAANNQWPLVIKNADSSNGYGATALLQNTGTGGRAYAVGVSSNQNNTLNGGKFYIQDYSNASTPYRFVIDSTGNVGIGTTNPSALLTITKSGGATTPVSDSNAVMVLDSGSNATNAWFNVPTTGTNATFGFARDGSYRYGLTYNVAGDYLAITNQAATPSPSSGIFLNNAGGVGVGANNATGARLYVENGNDDNNDGFYSYRYSNDDGYSNIAGHFKNEVMYQAGSGSNAAYGLYSEVNDNSGNGTTGFGLFSDATNFSTNWAGYFASGDVHIDNKLVLGDVGNTGTAPLYKLSIGTDIPDPADSAIAANGIKISNTSDAHVVFSSVSQKTNCSDTANCINELYFANQDAGGTRFGAATFGLDGDGTGLISSMKALRFVNNTSSYPHATIASMDVVSGNFGLATTTPLGRITSVASSTEKLPFFLVASSTDVAGTKTYQTLFTIASSTAYVGVASSSPWGLLSVNPTALTGPALVVGSSTATKFIVTNGGNVGIGTSNPTVPLEVKGTGTGATIAKFTDNNTTGCTLATGGTISCSSDVRLKKNITDIDYGLDALMALRPVRYNWNSEDDTTQRSLGFIAQEVEAVIPKLVSTDSDTGYKQLNTVGLVPVLAKSIQQQQATISGLSSTTQAFALQLARLSSSTPVTNTTDTSSSAALSDLNASITATNIRIDTLASSTLALVASTSQSFALQLASSSEVLASSTADSLASSTSFVTRIAQAVKDMLVSSTEWVFAKITSTLAIFDRVETKTAAVSDGLEMRDAATGTYWCVRIVNANFEKTPGPCAENPPSIPLAPQQTPPAPPSTPSDTGGAPNDVTASSTDSTSGGSVTDTSTTGTSTDQSGGSTTTSDSTSGSTTDTSSSSTASSDTSSTPTGTTTTDTGTSSAGSTDPAPTTTQ